MTAKEWREANKDYQKEWREANKNKVKEYQERYSDYQKEYQKIYQKEYNEKNKEKRNENKRIYEKTKKSLNPLYKLTCNIRTLICNSISRSGFSKKSRTNDILGCSFEEFKEYLESKFESWMTWENRGLYNGTPEYGWDVDHIMPVSKATTEEELLKLNHFSNLQPLCSKINRDSKRNTF